MNECIGNECVNGFMWEQDLTEYFDAHFCYQFDKRNGHGEFKYSNGSVYTGMTTYITFVFLSCCSDN
jgi:hypothetical protein